MNRQRQNKSLRPTVFSVEEMAVDPVAIGKVAKLVDTRRVLQEIGAERVLEELGTERILEGLGEDQVRAWLARRQQPNGAPDILPPANGT